MKQLNISNILFLVILVALITACNPNQQIPEGSALNSQESTSNTEQIEVASEDERIAWQKPETVIKLLGDIEGQTIADIGAGTGYFAFRLALKAEKVIALEIDENMVRLMDAFKVNLPTEVQSKFEARVCLPDDPLLTEDEVDKVIIINTITFIEDKLQYLKTLKKGLKKGGQVMIVDFKMKRLDIDGPDLSDRMPLFEIENLIEQAGFKIAMSDDTTLDYQYIVLATY